MKKISVLLTVLLFFIVTSNVVAQTAQHGTSVLVPKNKIINETYFASGESVTISGTINGDAYIAGGTLFIDGVINGDLLFAGGTANINGLVTGDIRGAGGQINIGGTVEGNVTAVGGNINIAQSAKIAKGLVSAGGQLNVIAPIGKGAVLAGGQVTLGNVINGNLLAATSELILSPEARILGDLNYYSDKKVTMQPGATVSGTMAFHQQEYKKYNPRITEKKREVQKAASGIGVAWSIYSALVTFILGALFVRLFPKFMESTSKQIDAHPFSTMGVGLLALICTPVIAIILFITIVGIPIGLILFILYGIYLYISSIFSILYIGNKVFEWFKSKQGMYLQLLVGTIILLIIANIPVVGWLVKFIVMITGMGTLLITKKTLYTSLKSKNLI